MIKKILVTCILLITYPVFSNENDRIVITLPGDRGIEYKIKQASIKNIMEKYIKFSAGNLIVCSNGVIENITEFDGTITIEIKFNAGDKIILQNLLECNMQRGEIIRRGQIVGKTNDTTGSIPVFCLMSSDYFNKVLDYSSDTIKIRCSEKTPVLSIANGTILDLGLDEQGDGMYLEFCNGNMNVRYTNLSRFQVLKNQLVRESQIIAYTGMTGNTRFPVLSMKLTAFNGDKKNYFVFVVSP
jgi:hypothetical protein